MKQTIGDFLLRRIKEAGAGEVFGVPGDYNLGFLQQLEDAGELRWVGTCNELNASYAADGYARRKGLAFLAVTYGVGTFSAMNGLAGAFCERVPIVCICGSPPLKSSARNLTMHHTLADGGTSNFLRPFAEVTVAQARLTPLNAAAEIDRLILAAWREKLPVYLEFPSDIAYLEIDAPSEPLQLAMPGSDRERLTTCSARILERLQAAKRPALLLDLDVERFDVKSEILELARRLQAPVATLATSKGAFPEISPLYVGTYAGAGSAGRTREAVEDSDCLLTVGLRRVDSTSGGFTDNISPNAVRIRSADVDVGPENFQAVYLRELLRALVAELPEYEAGAEPRQPPSAAAPVAGKLTQAALWETVQGFIRPGDLIIADIGTASAGAGGLVLPPGSTYISQAVWGSIGYSLGALLGTLLAEPERRHILFIGDGAFQMTAQELSTILRHELKPIVFLINNDGYTIERAILGKDSRYNDIAKWRYADLPKIFSPESGCTSAVASTAAELAETIEGPHDGMLFVEVILERDDAPASLIRGGNQAAELDYGSRGPQAAPNAQIRIPV